MGDGAEGVHIREIVRALRTLGHQVEVVALTGDPTVASQTRISRVNALRRVIPGAAYELAELGYNLVGYRRLLSAIRQFRPEVIYDRYNSYSTAALKAARRAGLPLLLEVNAPVAYERSVYEHLQLKFPRLARRYERTICSGADQVFAVSTPLKEYLVQTIGVEAGKIVVLPNGVDPDDFAPADGSEVRRHYGIEDRMVIGFVGILRPWHGLDLLLDAFQQLRHTLPTAHLLIVGDGPIQAEVDAQVRRLGIDAAVTITGRIPHGRVAPHVAAMDVCVSPHATFYASPLKILEYMAMGKAVVAPALDNLRDLVQDDVTGALFEAGNARSLEARLRQLLGDESLRLALGRRARRKVVEHHSWSHNARCIIERACALLGHGQRT
jgi:glycosyltransferase involved in cell wall biosynthesis